MRTDEGSTYEEWMNEIAADVQDEFLLPPVGHPLHELGKRLAHYLDDDKFNECERLLLEGWDHDKLGVSPARTKEKAMDWKKLPKDIPPCYTVGELAAELAKLPQELEIKLGFEDGVKPVVYNVKYGNRHLSFEENEEGDDD